MGIFRGGSRVARARRRFRDLCLAFPGVTESVSARDSAYRVGRETFAHFEEHGDEPRAAIRVGPEEFRDRSPESRLLLEKHVAKEGYMTLRIDKRTDWDELRGLLLIAYAAVAPKRRLQELDDVIGA